MASQNQYTPDYVIHPGEYLDDILEAKEMKKQDFVEKSMVSQANYKNLLTMNHIGRDDILKFSRENVIALGIIVGMLQHDNKIEYSWFNDLKEKYEFL